MCMHAINRLRVDLDCIVPYLTLEKSGISQIYHVKSGIWLGRPSVPYNISGAPQFPVVKCWI